MKKTIAALLVFVSAFLFCPEVKGAVLLDKVVATVNDEVITWSELMNIILFEGREYLGSETVKTRKEKIRELERPFLNKLIDMRLQLQEARKIGMGITEKEIDSAIIEIRSKYEISEEAFMGSLKREGVTFKDYRKGLAEQILLQKIVNFTIRSTVVVTDKEVEEYYDANRDIYESKKGKFRIRQIFFPMPGDASKRQGIERRAVEIWQRIAGGEDFTNLASEFSEGPARRFGGDLGYISSGSALKEIEDVAVLLKTGGVSRPFWSPAGLHIIKLEERVKAGGLEKVRDMIKEKLFRKTYELKYREWKAGLKEKAYIEIKL